MKKFSKKYVKDKTRNTSKYHFEANLCRKYGLKNKRELGVARALLQKYRAVTKNSNPAVVEPAIRKLVNFGLLKESRKEEILNLSIESFLDLRLQTLVSKKFNLTPREARQKITHGHVSVDNIKKRFPGYLLREANIEKISLSLPE